jgi:hypothetical protein
MVFKIIIAAPQTGNDLSHPRSVSADTNPDFILLGPAVAETAELATSLMTKFMYAIYAYRFRDNEADQHPDMGPVR